MTTEVSSREAEFPIEGMTCAACAAAVEQVLNRLPGVEAQVNLAAEQAHLRYDPSRVQPGQLLASVQKAGFDVPRRQLVLGVEGMSCAACSAAVEKALKQLPQVQARVNLASAQVVIDYQPALVSEAELADCIRRTGYLPSAPAQPKASELQARDQAAHKAWRRARLQAVWASLLALPLLLPMLAMLWPGAPAWLAHPGLSRGWQLALATPVQFWAGAGFYRAAWKALRGRHANMDVLVVLGTSVAYVYSLAVVLGGLPGEVYFDSSAVIISLILWGRLMESRARRQTTAAVRALVQLQPEQARVERDGGVVSLDVGLLKVGDIVQVPAGEQIPVDGVVVSGESSVDESMLSGEAMPVAKAAGSAVHAASLNGTGWLRLRATRVGGETMLARMIRRVEQAQGSKAPVQRLADRVAAIFVPAVLVLALLTFGATWAWTGHLATAMIHAVAVLVIACPCALGLATPTAIMVGSGVAARSGILIRDASVLEQLGKVKVMVFDKTGTLTRGRPVLVSTVQAPGQSAQEALRWAASLEAGSAHPLAQAFVAAADTAGLHPRALPQLQTVVGQGLEAVSEGRQIRLGRLEWVLDGAPPPAWLPDPEAARAQAQVLVALGLEGEMVACFSIGDPLREDARTVVSGLAARGLRTVMLTGDHAAAAAAIAGQSGVDSFQASVLPEGKADRIQALQRSAGGPVAMIGDGINDAPALATADIGIGMGGGSMMAVEVADVVLLQDRLSSLLQAIELSRTTRRTIRQNLGFAFGYNLIGLPLAALGWLNPMLAGAIMALSSISVVGNSLRLGRMARVPSRSPAVSST